MTNKSTVSKPEQTAAIELQIKAIESQARLLKVQGGTGCGKTHVITRRAQYLLSKGCSPKGIQIITANRQGVSTINARLAIADIVGLEDIAVDTVESFCIRLLGTEAACRQTGRIPRLLNSVEEVFLIEDLKLLGFKPIELRDLLEELYERWANLVEVRESHLAKLEATVVSLLKERNAMLPVELPRTVLQYLSDLGEHHPGIHVPHLLIDDYQMLDFAAQTLLGLLYSSSLTIAYDPLQSLLSIQPDAIPWELKELDEKTSDGKDPALQKSQVLDHQTIILKESQHCPRDIISVENAIALSLIERAEPERKEKVAAAKLLLDSRKDAPPGRVSLVKWLSPQQECEGVCSWLRKRLNSDEDQLVAENVLVIVLNSALGRQFARQLDTSKVAHEDLFSRNLLRGNPQRDDLNAGMRSYSLLTLAAYPNDVVAWRSWCGYGDKQLNSKLWSSLVSWALTENIGISEALQRLGEDNGDVKPFPQSEKLAEAWRSANEILTSVKGKCGQHLLRKLLCGDDATLADFELLFENTSSDDTAHSLHYRIHEQLLDPTFTSDKKIRIGSPHTVIGLHADVVIVLGMIDGLIPTEPPSLPPSEGKEKEQVCQLGRKSLHDIVCCTGNEIIFSYFQKTELEIARRLGIKIRRTRNERGVDMALLSPSRFLDEMGNAIPATEAFLPI